MLGYEWGNPSTIMLSGDENVQESDQNRQIFDPYGNEQSFSSASANLVHNNQLAHFPPSHHQPPENHHHHLLFHNPHGQEASHNVNTTHFPTLYDPHYGSGHNTHLPDQASLLSLEPAGPTGYMMVPKTEPVMGEVDFTTGGTSSRIGLNLGVRTYFSSDDDFVNRLYRRSRAVEAGSINSPKCQAEGCNADLTHAKHYHRRHKVCEFHSKASTVITSGLTQRFCQQCSRFHLLSEFDNGKRSCRKRLADHNKRRRKSHHNANQENDNKSHQLNSPTSDSLLARSSPSNSGVQTSLVTAAVSSPKIFSLDYGSFSNG